MYSSEIVEKSPWDKLNIARDKNRPNARFYIENIFNDFIELHGDRYYKDDSAIIGGIASVNNINVTVIGINKGKDTGENIKNNFGPFFLMDDNKFFLFYHSLLHCLF